jgi:hypothetical protein
MERVSTFWFVEMKFRDVYFDSVPECLVSTAKIKEGRPYRAFIGDRYLSSGKHRDQ